jgi:hypothetical protein
MVSDEIEIKTEVDGQEYTLTVNYTKVIDKDDPEIFMFYGIFFK